MRKAAEMLGGREELARALQVPRDEVEKWIVGEKKPPRDLFLRVVDLLIEDGAGTDGAGEPPAGRDASGSTHAAMFD